MAATMKHDFILHMTRYKRRVIKAHLYKTIDN